MKNTFFLTLVFSVTLSVGNWMPLIAQSKSYLINYSNQSPSAEQSSLDSTIQEKFQSGTNAKIDGLKKIYTYDENDNHILNVLLQWDTISHTWINSIKHELNYDKNNNQTLYSKYLWNRNLNRWDGEIKEEYGFDSFGNETSRILYGWINDNWRKRSLIELKFDSHGNELLKVLTTWNYVNENVIQEGEKTERQYDENGIKVSELTFIWEAGEWVFSKKKEINFTLLGEIKQTEEVSFKWNRDSVKWLKEAKNEIKYGADNFKKEQIFYLWNSSNLWEISSRLEFQTDMSGNILKEIHFLRQDNKWINYGKKEFAYNNENVMIMNATYTWGGLNLAGEKDWKGTRKYEYVSDQFGNTILDAEYVWNNYTWNWKGTGSKKESEYDPFGNLLLSTWSSWDETKNEWIFRRQTKVNYNENLKPFLNENFEWDLELEKWLFYSKNEYTYDLSNNLTYKIFKLWDNENQIWENGLKLENIYSDSEVLETTEEYVWDKNNNIWKGITKINYKYNMEYKFEDLILPLWINLSEFKRMLISKVVFNWDATIKDWIKHTETNYFYSELLTNISDFASSNIKIYPNPANDFMFITNVVKPVQFDLYNLNGQNLIQKQITCDKRIPVSHLDAGVYLFIIKDDEKATQKGKLVINHSHSGN